jgi:4-diphosphocytidyl-2-C-methyl-D-erythritol kinase
MMRLRAEAQAKVNLALAVTGRRDDGYHILRSVFLRTTLHDELEVDTDPDTAEDSLQVDGEPVDPGPSNLVLVAVAHLRKVIDGPLPALRFSLTKRIPTAAGLGGGSSDGAAALDLAQAAWGVRLHPTARLEVALRLGADVPFFTVGHAAALVSGIGEGLRPLWAPEPAAGLLLVTPAERLATAAVFAAYDEMPTPGSDASERVDEIAGLLREPVDGMTLAATTTMLRDGNDLWAAAAHRSPSLAAARDATSDLLGHAMLMSGSGPTLFAVYASEAAAESAGERLRAASLPELEGATIIATSTVSSRGTP